MSNSPPKEDQDPPPVELYRCLWCGDPIMSGDIIVVDSNGIFCWECRCEALDGYSDMAGLSIGGEIVI